MNVIVTVVIKNVPSGKVKRLGMDILGRQSTDIDSQHKSILVVAESISEAEKNVLDQLKSENISARVSRSEVITDHVIAKPVVRLSTHNIVMILKQLESGQPAVRLTPNREMISISPTEYTIRALRKILDNDEPVTEAYIWSRFGHPRVIVG
jgi:hypothetical protein